MGIGVAGLVGALTGAVIAAIGIVVTVVEGRRTRRNTEFSVHRDLWWQRWSWVADRALSADVTERERAALMAHALMTRDWATSDDYWVMAALEETERRLGSLADPPSRPADPVDPEHDDGGATPR